MLRHSLPFVIVAALSGCVLTEEQYRASHEGTLNAIEQSESSVNTHIDGLYSRINHQQTTIQQLQVSLELVTEAMQEQNALLLRLQRQINQQRYVVQQRAESEPTPVAASTPAPSDKIVLGAEEWVWFDLANSQFKARVDTGATTSSLNATDIQEFEREGKNWVRFNLAHTQDDLEGRHEIIEAPVVRWVKIRQSSADSTDRRPVIEAWIRIGDIHEKTQFTLADRTQMEYPILLGREFFQDIAVVDVARSFVQGKVDPAASK
uniref:ATP-dependent zinc protease family protein n=1 Tax=Thaumasiovibrio occultus TaxID=1891184 RepID=UPI000B361D91|nr:ATP-dependent zinc protease [Thaumasiovibrio occultus]